MHYTLHLTQTIGDTIRLMPPEIALQVRQLAQGGTLTFVANGLSNGDPMAADVLAVIRTVVDTSVDTTVDEAGDALTYQMTTNDVGLDEAFLSYATEHHIAITFVWDGVRPLQKAARLLSFQPHAAVQLKVAPETLPEYATHIKTLYDLGFRYLYAILMPGAPWRETHLPQLKRQYRTLASFYREKNRQEEKLFFAPFDTKIAARVQQRSVQCALGQQEIAITPDGKLYPCSALCEESFCMGDLTHGIDAAKQQQLRNLNGKEAAACAGCAIHDRCVHHCACINQCATGSITSPSPFQCAHERILIPIADSLAERLYHERNALFMQKQYNTLYPTLSLAEEK